MASVGYDLTPDLLAFGSYARKVRFPTIDQLFDPQQGNATLRPEQSDNYETGLAWTIAPKAQLRASVFRNNVTNFILNDQLNQVFVNSDVTISGFQISGTYSPMPTLTFRPGYTYLDMCYPSSGLPVDYRPRHVVDMLVAYEPLAGLQVSSDFSYFVDQSVGSRSNAAVRQASPTMPWSTRGSANPSATASAAMCAPPISSTARTSMPLDPGGRTDDLCGVGVSFLDVQPATSTRLLTTPQIVHEDIDADQQHPHGQHRKAPSDIVAGEDQHQRA